MSADYYGRDDDCIEMEMLSLIIDIEGAREIVRVDGKLDVSALLDIILHCKILKDKRKDCAIDDLDAKIMGASRRAEILLKSKIKYLLADYKSKYFRNALQAIRYTKTCTDFSPEYKNRRNELREIYIGIMIEMMEKLTEK